MKWFVNLSTRNKLFIGFGITISLMILIILTAISGMNSLERAQNEIFENDFRNSVDLQILDTSESEVRNALLMMSMVSGKANKEHWHSRVEEKSKELDRLFNGLLERNRDKPEILDRLEEINGVRRAFVRTRDEELIPFIYKGEMNRARDLALGIQDQRYQRMRSISTVLAKGAQEEARQSIRRSAEMAEKAVTAFITLGLIAVLASVFLTAFLNRLIASPLKEISEVAGEVASGNLTVDTPASGREDEMGMLERTFAGMVGKLRDQIRDIADAVNVLASSSNEIAVTSAQLASGAEQTAVAVAETTTTVEEVKQTCTMTSQKAKHVSEISQKAVTVSQKGSELVSETIQGINRIKEQMEYIAETIVKLSGHNQAIGEIIAAVDDLAEQSNLLAVNASIEASKAGEQGKGFMVVAQEIRNMALQSKQATKQVRAILGDIQRSSNTAVMATEKGSNAVEKTAAQSTGTGEAIRELSRSIMDASQAVMQIAASNQQQLVGMDQVAQAMGNIRQASNQNAAGTKQVEVTVRSLKLLGEKLKTITDSYRV
ncbi:MAG: methyl-accepting chemotaxis protein [Deltaproteobacteria bacterium]|nr:methyl-accepting chemotaxis protein [Deltaproteobacteria bacterium]